MGQRLVQVDAFTNHPFSGNPAAVCLLEQPAEESSMQDLAREMNLSETAFLVRRPGGFDLRWFTPGGEVDLCGHATLASAHVLWEDGHLETSEEARFHTRSGPLSAVAREGWIEMDFPAEPAEPVLPPEELVPALGATPLWVGKNRFDYLLELETKDDVTGLDPDFSALARIPARGFIVTAPTKDADSDFVSRFFAPRYGVPEDPVTGSAHCCLAPFWAPKLGKREMLGYQASPRGGWVKVRPQGKRVKLSGQAVTVLRAEIVV